MSVSLNERQSLMENQQLLEHLSQNEILGLNDLIGNQCKSLAAAIVQILHENGGRWKKQACGVLCFITDYNKQIYCFRLYDLRAKESIYEGLVLSCLRLNKVLDTFYTFDGMTCKVGINFLNSTEAETFCNQVHTKQENRQKKEKSKISISASPIKGIISKYSSISKGSSSSKRTSKTPIISNPTNFTQIIGIGPNGSYVTDDAHKKLFEEVLACMDLSSKDKKFIRKSVYENHTTMEALFTKSVHTDRIVQQSTAPPIPPRPIHPVVEVPDYTSPPPMIEIISEQSVNPNSKTFQDDICNFDPTTLKPIRIRLPSPTKKSDSDLRQTLEMNILEKLCARRAIIRKETDVDDCDEKSDDSEWD
ncbi:hypothetical protein I4U23_000983 [Adineta vaga]|nr:hypothetical protein I4U23_000983 [Adineta vaga]